MFEKILVAHDGAQRAFETALELSARLGADLYMVSVEENLPHYAQTVAEVRGEKEKADEFFEELSDQCRRRAALQGKTLYTNIIPGNGVKAIVEFIRQGGYDLLVVGYTGHSKIYDHIWGGTSQNLTRLAPCSVLVVK
jgi:nucleotide-binding universal stress UspA family protein